MREKTFFVSALILLLIFVAVPLSSIPADAQITAETHNVDTAPAITIAETHNAETGEGTTPWTVFIDHFENKEDWAKWHVGDWNLKSGYDYWGRELWYTGHWYASCRAVGLHGYNNYDNDMAAYMYRDVDLRGCSGAYLSYRFYLYAYSPDYFCVMYRVGENWYYKNGETGGMSWTYRKNVIIPTDANAVGFYFYSDSTKTWEGAFVDDVELMADGYSVTIQSWDYQNGWQTSVPITMNGMSMTEWTTPYTFTGLGGTNTFTVPSTNSAGHLFSEWSTGWTDPTITVSSGGTYTANYRDTYSVTIWAWDYHYGWLTVPIIKDDQSSTSPLPSTDHTFTGLVGTHTFEVPGTDSVGHTFSEWSIGWTGSSLPVDRAGVYTAYYRAGYCATIRSWCAVDGWIEGLQVTEDDWPSGGLYTPRTFPGLTGTHTFTIPYVDAEGHTFYGWYTGWMGTWNTPVGTSTTLTVASAGMYTACYEEVAPTLTVTVPNGGEKWIQGTTHTLAWSFRGLTESVIIELLKGEDVDSIITSETPNDGSYSWQIPSTLTLGIDYKIRITSTGDAGVTDSSDYKFSIVAGMLTVTSPNGGEVWDRGGTYAITWSKSGSIGPDVRIELWGIEGFVGVIETVPAGVGSYSWTIPLEVGLGGSYRIRIKSTAYPSISDFSNKCFAIT